MTDAGALAMLSASLVKTIAMATGVYRHVMWRLACMWLLTATFLLVMSDSVVDVTRSVLAAVAKRS